MQITSPNEYVAWVSKDTYFWVILDVELDGVIQFRILSQKTLDTGQIKSNFIIKVSQ